MRVITKIAAISMAMVIYLTCGINGYAASNGFKDIKGNEAEASIIALVEKGYVKGVTDTLFAPNAHLTQAQGIQLIVNIMELNLDNIRFIKAPKATDYYKNVNNEAWYADAMIITGVKNSIFPNDLLPNAMLSKEVFVEYLVKSMNLQYDLPMIKLDPQTIKDEAEIAIERSGFIQQGLYYGIVNLDVNNEFNPKAFVTRGEAAVMVKNVLDYNNQRISRITNKEKFETSLTETSDSQKIQLKFEMTNITKDDLLLTFSSGQKYDFKVYDEKDNLVYQWSEGKAFTMALVYETLDNQKSLVFKEQWDYRDNEGKLIPKGSYRILFENMFFINDDYVNLDEEITIDVP